MKEETTCGGRLVQTGMVEGKNKNLHESLDGFNGIYLHGWKPRVCLVDGVSHLCQASPADVYACKSVIICSLI